jgi:hypothetical protein
MYSGNNLTMSARKIYCFIILILGWNICFSQQVLINFNPAVYGQSLEGLSFAQMVNLYPQDLNGAVTIRVRETHAGNVATIRMPAFLLRRGSNTIDRLAFSKALFSFGKNKYGSLLSQSGKFPEGEYEFCFEIDLSSSKLPAGALPVIENCFIHEVHPLTPLLLINPVDGDEDCNKRPQFTWQPPMPMPMNARFRLILTELKEKQDPIEAINFNTPIINQGNIPVNQLNFPFNAPELKEGKKYVWQVTVYTEKIILEKSELWLYKVKCPEENLEQVSGSYREMKEGIDGNYYVADKIVRFSFNNPYNAGVLSYTIVSLANPGLAIKNLPKLDMQAGLNKHELDLRERKDFKNNQEYLLSVHLANDRELKLRFLYKNE